jgi:hypothetical protein
MTFEDAMNFQAEFCDTNGAPITAAACRALTAGLDRTTATGRRVIDWRGNYIDDAVPLRLVAPYHALFRQGAIDRFDRVEDIRAATVTHDTWIERWLDGPPQTNEPGRSATFVACLLVLAQRFNLPFELIEIGSSAGLNLLIDRYRYDLGGVVVGPGDAPVTIAPEWRGPPPPRADIRIASVRGVDIAPIDVTDPAAAERLLAYVWADTPERSARVEAAIGMIHEHPVNLEQGEAADFVEAQLARPQASGTMRILMHSIVWQYLPSGTQARITAAMERAGAAATGDRPLGWVQFENGWTRHVGVRCWPDGAPEVELAKAHPHGTWVEWSGQGEADLGLRASA